MPSDQPIAYFVRHGTTDGNAKGLFRGKNDYPLDSEGITDAKKLAGWFSDKDISSIYASPKKRAQSTAEEIAKPKGIQVQTEKSLGPVDVGYLSGEPKDKHKNVMSYFEKFPNEHIPMGDSINGFRARVQPPIKKMLVEGAHSKYPVVAVVHSSIIHELNHIVSGDHNDVLVKPGGVVGVFKHPEKGLEIRAMLHPETKPGQPYAG